MADAISAGSDYFNDLLQQPPSGFPSSRSHHSSDQPGTGQIAGSGPTQNEEENGQVPRPKRIACVICRKRKLRCDGKRPSCGTCSRLGHDCAYDEVRRKSGPKRGYVKQLEARLGALTVLLYLVCKMLLYLELQYPFPLIEPYYPVQHTDTWRTNWIYSPS